MNPWFVNFSPSNESKDVRLLRPIQFSVRDSDTNINLASMRVAAGFTKIFSNGEQFFNKQLPFTTRVHLENVVGGEPTLSLVTDGVFVQQAGILPQRTVYATTIDSNIGIKSVALSAIVKPGSSNAEGSLGAVLAIENGPRNMVIYLWFQKVTGSPILRLTSSIGGSPTINQTASFDWTALRRYTILWNEADGYLEVYAAGASADLRVFRVAITSIPTIPPTANRFGGPSAVVALYGVHPNANGDSITIRNMAFSNDMAYPVLGTNRPGDFVTRLLGAELVRSSGERDFRNDVVSSWTSPLSTRFPQEDPAGVSGSTAGIFHMSKPTSDKTFVVYREEPGLLKSDDDGFMVQARLHASPTTTIGASTGMGMTICDGQTVFQLQLFKDPTFNTIGLLKKTGTLSDITWHDIPTTNFDWKGGRPFRFVVDPRRALIEFFDSEDLLNPTMSLPFDRATLPSVSDMGWSNVTPFIALGHIHAIATTGDLLTYNLEFNHLYQGWDARDASANPTAADPAFSLSQSSATVVEDNDEWKISTPNAGLCKYSRAAEFGFGRGAIVETYMRVESWRPKTKTGVYIILDDGTRLFAVTFVDSSTGKYVALSQRSGLSTFTEIVGRDGEAAKVSFLLDWTVFHTYRLERSVNDGFRLFVDDEKEPRLTFPEAKLSQLPNSLYGGTPTVGFGHYTSEGAVSRWKYLHGLFSRGYDVSFKKNKPDGVLQDELFKTQAIVVAHAQDNDA